MEKRYKALRAIGSIYKIFGIISAALTILSILGICAATLLGGATLDSFNNEFGSFSGLGLMGGALGGLILAFFTILSGGGAALTCYAFGEGIFLLIAMEENTRASAALLMKQNQ